MQASSSESHAMELINNGFLKYAERLAIANLEIQLKSSFDIYDEGYFRIAHIDAEELAEFSFDFFLPNLNAILAKRGTQLSIHESKNTENEYYAIINGDAVKLYTRENLSDDTFWDVSARNLFQKINTILRVENIEEQFYLLYSGNDLHVMLLTNRQFLIIADYYKSKPSEIPYRP